MNRLTFRFVIGFVILLMGAMMIVDLLFDLHVPVIRAAVSFLLLAFGARMAVHAWQRHDRANVAGEAWLSDRRFAPTGLLARDTHFDVVFGRGVIDLTRLDEPADDVTITVDTLFGAAVVKMSSSVPYDVEGNSAFGEVRMPDRTMAAVGSVSYHPMVDHAPRLHLRVNTVFGACQVVEAATAAAATTLS